MDMTLIDLSLLTCTCWNEKQQPLTIDMFKEIYTSRYRIGLFGIVVPLFFTHFSTLQVSFYHSVTRQNMIVLSKSAKYQKKSNSWWYWKKSFLKHTPDRKLAESFEKLTWNLEEIGESTRKTRRNLWKNLSDSYKTPKLVSTSDELLENFSKLKASKNFFKVTRDAEGIFSWNEFVIFPLGGKGWEGMVRTMVQF